MSYCQHVSKNSYTGTWEQAGSWEPEWTTPVRDSIAVDITINGYIKTAGSVSFANYDATLIINDTLVIYGNLFLGNNTDLIINSGGILIIKGNLSLSNKTDLAANSYLIIAGNVTKLGSGLMGTAYSNDIPEKVFVTGSVDPPLIDGYPMFDTTVVESAQHSHSGYAFGDGIDLANDPVNSFVVSTCSRKVTGISPVCSGQTIILHSEGGTSYLWNGPDGFTSTLQDPILPNAMPSSSGTYSVEISGYSGCGTEIKSIDILVNKPLVNISSNSPVCSGNSLSLLSSGGTSYNWAGPLGFTSNQANPVIEKLYENNAGRYSVTVTDVSNCSADTSIEVVVNALPDPEISSNSPVCSGGEIRLSCNGGNVYSWKGPAGFSDNRSVISISEANGSLAGIYEVTVRNLNNCSAKDSVNVVVNSLPDVTITSEHDSLCTGENVYLTGTPAGGIFSLVSGQGSLSSDSFSATGAGNVNIEYAYDNGCRNKAVRSLTVIDRPVADAGSDQSLEHVYTATLDATSDQSSKGTWSLISGAGQILDESSPGTGISGLQTGENIFRWTVSNGYCTESSDIKIVVADLTVPSVITPNNDGVNDKFSINVLPDHATLTIMNKWGNIEFRSKDYMNDWDGRNSSGDALPEDTYFFILDLGNGILKKGSVIIIR
ncbi:MAG TPA: gliding motility-associated C-terminal domain-containing protein [Bacteroidales bacterium]|nr:gliding motility-associated C-terminal domain-containing protein [Bacteroidales bacterium]